MIDNETINRSISYIMENLDENLSVEDVANYCNFSKYHFSRMFKEETKESLYAFIKRLKMEKSALKIKVEKEKLITEIGMDYGYSSSNYSVAFKEFHKLSPIEFRIKNDRNFTLNPFKDYERYTYDSFDDYNKNISIEYVEDMFVIYERSIGNYSDLKEKWEKFFYDYKNYIRDDTLFIERSYDDPTVTDMNKCIYDICMTISSTDDIDLDNVMCIKGGKYVVYKFEGESTNIFSTFQGIFSIWLEKSGNLLDNRYGFEIYREIDCENMNFKIDFYIPIK